MLILSNHCVIGLPGSVTTPDLSKSSGGSIGDDTLFFLYTLESKKCNTILKSLTMYYWIVQTQK